MNIYEKFRQLLKENKLYGSFICITDDVETTMQEILFDIKYSYCLAGSRPCGCCDFCKIIENRTFADLSIVERKQNKRDIGIDRISESIIEFLSLHSHYKNKIVLIKESEKMSISAQNSLLKILEEPNNSDDLIILISSKYWMHLPTIRSRCRLIRNFEIKEEKEKFKLNFQYSLLEKQEVNDLLTKKIDIKKWLKKKENQLKNNRDLFIEAINLILVFKQNEIFEKKVFENYEINIKIYNLINYIKANVKPDIIYYNLMRCI